MTVDAHRIVSRLWQGADPAGIDLHGAGFNVLILCAQELQHAAAQFPGVRVIHAPMDDSATVPFQAATRAARQGARLHRAGAQVLVTCHHGINRSGLVTALMLWYLTPGASGRICATHVRGMRPGALGNSAFRRYLEGLPPRGRARAWW